MNSTWSMNQADTKGAFRIPGLVAGAFQLTAFFYRTMPEDLWAKPGFAGMAANNFTLPKGEGDFDLGQLPWIPPEEIRVRDS